MDRFESMRREIEESLTLRQRHHSLHLRGSRGESGDAGQHGMAAEVEVAEEQQEPHLLPQLPFTVSIGTAPFQSISSECRILLWHEVSGQPVERMRYITTATTTTTTHACTYIHTLGCLAAHMLTGVNNDNIAGT